jgi:intracellular sulfur oxidation DsrE/DsrF family protein
MTEPGKSSSIVILISRDGMGKADKELSQKLIQTYLNLLDLGGQLPAAICFYAEGIRLVLTGSPLLAELQSLQDKGVHLIVCGTCVNYYGVADKVRVGRVGSMKDVVAAQWEASKVITL